ncbi:MAG: cytochrome c oxidase subunit II [Deltaproteobacteria bacterium]|nr:cytochrome c oxidase subunit II [Deltaproteobacteria bacterium]
MTGWLPEDISTFGHGIDHTLRVIYYIVGAWFVLAEAVLFYFIIRYRKGANRKATYQPGTTSKALAWILLPAVLILAFDLGIDLVQGPVWNEIKIYLPSPDQTVRITGRQFVWEITHPGPDNQIETADDIQTLNQFVVPVHKKIVFELKSQDVLHSLWIPNLRLKQDAVPGRTIKGWFEATKEGTYPLACAELCGSGHGTMKGELHVLSEPDYQNWLRENRGPEVGSAE